MPISEGKTLFFNPLFLMGHFNFESSLSDLNGTIGENTDFNAENSAKALHKAFHRKCGV